NAAKFYEVSEQIVLTSHMVQPVFFAIAKPVWDKLNADQQKALDAAARKTAKAGSDSRLADEKAIVQALKDRGLAVDTVDLAPFRASADRGKASATGRLDCLRHVRRRVRHLQLQDLHSLFRARRSGLDRRSFGDPV